MFIYEEKDISTIMRGVIAQGVNCQIKMISGVAAAIRHRHPHGQQVYGAYTRDCWAGPHNLGTNHIVSISSELKFANCFTQVYYGQDGQRYADPKAIHKCFIYPLPNVALWGLPLYIPRIGCKRGGLDWDIDVKPAIDAAVFLTDFNQPITVCDWNE